VTFPPLFLAECAYTRASRKGALKQAIGMFKGSHASDMGSIPIARSIA
jgi:hypothetical protein